MEWILKDGEGNILEAVEKISEAELAKLPTFTHCLAVVKVKDDYLLGWNRLRRRG